VKTTSGRWPLRLTNSGSAPLEITSIAITGTNASDFAQTNNCQSPLAAGATCTITITFTPAAPGPRTANVMFTDNAAGSPHNEYLVGVGK